jgi:hypothetical protein
MVRNGLILDEKLPLRQPAIVFQRIDWTKPPEVERLWLAVGSSAANKR